MFAYQGALGIIFFNQNLPWFKWTSGRSRSGSAAESEFSLLIPNNENSQAKGGRTSSGEFKGGEWGSIKKNKAATESLQLPYFTLAEGTAGDTGCFAFEHSSPLCSLEAWEPRQMCEPTQLSQVSFHS